jgi:membrane protease YdiL (CAAX protease family)
MSEPTNEPPLVTRLEAPLVTRVEPPAPARPRPGFLEALLWCVAFWVVLLASTLATVAIVLTAYALRTDDMGQFFLDQFHAFGAALTPPAPNKPPPPAMPKPFANALVTGMFVGQVGTLAFVLIVLPRRMGRDWQRQLGLGQTAAMHLVLVTLMVPGFIVLAMGIQELFASLTGLTTPPTEVLLRGLLKDTSVLVMLGAVAVGPGIVEELWCRGFLGRGLCARYGLVWGIVLTSVLFSALHLSLEQCFVFVVMGAYLHFVYLVSRSIWVPILLHLLNNGLQTVSLLSPELYSLWEAFEKDAHGYRRVMDVAALGVMVFGSFALWSCRAMVVPTRQSDGTAARAWEPEYPGISHPPPDAPLALRYGAISPVAMVLTLASVAVLLYLFTHPQG